MTKRTWVLTGVVMLMVSGLWWGIPAGGALEIEGGPVGAVQAGAGEEGGQARLVGVELVSQWSPALVGQEFAVAVVLDVAKGWHLYANPKQGDFGLDTEIKPVADERVRFGRTIYPPGTEYTDQGASNHIYEGRVVCYVAVTVVSGEGQGEAGAGPLRLDMELSGLLCGEEGVCQPWEERVSTELVVTSEAGQARQQEPELFAGVVFGGGDDQAGGPEPGEPAGAAAGAERTIEGDDWVTPLLLAIVAGLVMNLMPCVLPLIPVIVLTLMKQCAPEPDAEPDRVKSIKVGLAFAAGIMLVFVGLAVVMSVFKLLWGQQFQGTGFKFVLLMVVYVLSLSMFGLFEIVLPGKLANANVAGQGYFGAMGMGMLVTVLGTPCGAPLLTPVLAWSLGKSLPITMVVFLVIGLGMAAPYVLLTAFPKLLNRVPRGGQWMILLKQAIGFAMLGYAGYLVFLFEPGWREPLVYLCVFLGFCVWLGVSVVHQAKRAGWRWAARVAALVLLAGGVVGFAMMDKTSASGEGTYWLTELEGYQQQGRTVIVKFTANWCKNCATLDKLIYKRDVFKEKLQETNAVLVVADWSYDDAEIKAVLEGYGTQTLPFAAVFPGADPKHPILLRDFYSMENALGALDEAAKRGAK